MTLATPRMISQSGLVCLPAAGNAGVGRRMASTKAHSSTTRAASQSASKNQASGVITPAENTPLGYLVRALYGPRATDRGWRPGRSRANNDGRGCGPGPGGAAWRDPPGVARGSGLAGPRAALVAWRAVERALALAGAAPVEGLLAALGQLVVLGRCPRAGGADGSARAGGQRVHRGLVAPPGKPGGQLPQRFRGEHAGSCRGVHGLAVGKLAHLGPDIHGAVHDNLTLPGLNGQAFLGGAPALPRRSFPGWSRRARRRRSPGRRSRRHRRPRPRPPRPRSRSPPARKVPRRRCATPWRSAAGSRRWAGATPARSG